MNSLATRHILVMRHAEKPDDAGDPNLSPAGYARAKQLATYIPDTFGKPDVIIAAANSAESLRPDETATPLAQQCGLDVQMPYPDDQFVDAAQLMLTGTGYKNQPLIVCCWHHGKLPKPMHALGCEKGSYPDPWDETVFNLILKVGIRADGTIKVDQMPEPF
ncbi:histidine phosphatase family protein [Paraburkholderia sp. IMGN_8]|uniref:histidine phosphatase family protein n=1 Tax=Paraburkholderia sp. IMGN_8 TaxID=3136564 RepID=UPI0031012668